MLAMNYRGPLRVRIDHKPMPEIQHPQDAVVRAAAHEVPVGEVDDDGAFLRQARRIEPA